MVTLTEDTVNASVLEDICRLLEGVQNDKQGAKRLLKNIRNGEDAQLRLDTLQVVRINSTFHEVLIRVFLFSFLSWQLANIPDIPTWLRSSIFKTILHLSEKSKLIPQALMINKVETLEDDPVDSGSFGNLWMGKLEGKSGLVHSGYDVLVQAYMQEAVVWQQLEHPNVLPFMGVFYMNEKQTELCLVSPWMENGNLCQFLKTASEKKVAVDHYLLVHDIASGLAYLHENKIIHSDLKGVSVGLCVVKRR
ncbi:kinase-like protein [Marasmius fiardii PR-910]|nr:kinase-like protein [Marasmius fiardii PR-910]